MASVAEQDGEKLSEIARKSVEVTRRADRANEFSHAFILPAVLWYEDATITDRIATWERSLSENRTLLVRNQGELDEITFRVYDISDEDRQAISATFGQTEPAPFIDDPIAQEVESDQELSETVVPAVIVADLVSYALGCTFGRWDIRIALDPLLAPELQGPFEPLPVCSPGILVGPDGLPATSGRIVSEAWLRARPNAITLPPEGAVAAPVISDRDYPLRVEWDGILVDDPDHADDLVRRVREVFDLLWGEQAEAIEREACQILGVRELRDYLCNPRRFFDAHLKRYSKSRRKAPIYWPLSTASGSYTLWLYYPRLTSDTLYTAVNRYVEPKQRDVARSLRDVETRLTDATGRAATDLRTERERLSDLSTELEEFRAELLRVAGLPYRPNLDDGVIINAAPLWGLFRHRAWARATHECWQKLEQGDYDWAHLAYEVWPERVREKCRTDRSLAIAHGLDGGGEARPREGAERTQVALSEESGG